MRARAPGCARRVAVGRGRGGPDDRARAGDGEPAGRGGTSRRREMIQRESAAPAGAGTFDATADIVVVGGGGGGLPAALFARWLGDEVILLEKAPELGGTAK